MKLIYRAGDIIEAHIIAGLLEAGGVEAHVSGHYLQGAVGELAPGSFSNIHVPDEDIEKAKLVIDEYEKNQNKPTSIPEPSQNPLLTKVIAAGIFIFFIVYIYILTQ
jgi:Putative prokaryotic signal transducing protein